jgi:hypothetical protein
VVAVSVAVRAAAGVAAVVAAGVTTGVAADVEMGVEAGVEERFEAGLLAPAGPVVGVIDADGAGEASVPGVGDAADSAADGSTGARITVGATVTTGRTAIVTRCESGGVHAWAPSKYCNTARGESDRHTGCHLSLSSNS